MDRWPQSQAKHLAYLCRLVFLALLTLCGGSKRHHIRRSRFGWRLLLLPARIHVMQRLDQLVDIEFDVLKLRFARRMGHNPLPLNDIGIRRNLVHGGDHRLAQLLQSLSQREVFHIHRKFKSLAAPFEPRQNPIQPFEQRFRLDVLLGRPGIDNLTLCIG
jgi:hypothetical protein